MTISTWPGVPTIAKNAIRSAGYDTLSELMDAAERYPGGPKAFLNHLACTIYGFGHKSKKVMLKALWPGVSA